jgi:hypothetical protein
MKTLKVLTLLILVASSVSMLAQTIAISHSPDPDGTIDGAKNPELISDEIAWRMFLLSNAESQTPTAEEVHRQLVKLSVIHLPNADRDFMINQLAKFHTNVTTLDRAITSSASANLGLDVQAGQDARRQLFASVRSQIMSGISAEGTKAMNEHIQNIKRNIKIYPYPASMTSHMQPIN